VTLALGNGQPDSFFIAEVRRIFRDQGSWQQETPASDGSRGAIATAGSLPIHLQRPPVLRSVPVYLTAPTATGEVGAVTTSYLPLFDPPAPTPNPVIPPSASDGGAGGTFTAGNHQVAYTYVVAGVEYGLSPLSGIVSLAANHQLTVAALTNLPAAVSAVNDYLVAGVAPEVVGRLGQRVVVASTAATATYAAPPSGANAPLVPALITSDTGEVQFPLAPPTGSVAIRYQTARYSDQQILEALYEGLGMLWPEVWSYQPFDLVSVLPSPVQYEYPLPVVPYADPKTIITQVETRPPQAWVRFRRISGWRFAQDPLTPTLIFERTPPTGGQVRITAVQPFQQLADVPGLGSTGILLPPANLPVYYAVGRLLADAEVMRSRSDDLPALTGENAGSEKGGNLQTATFWFQSMFAPELAKLSIGKPARRMVAHRIVERLGLSSIWQEAA
jgi:hypothetical protein